MVYRAKENFESSSKSSKGKLAHTPTTTMSENNADKLRKMLGGQLSFGGSMIQLSAVHNDEKEFEKTLSMNWSGMML